MAGWSSAISRRDRCPSCVCVPFAVERWRALLMLVSLYYGCVVGGCDVEGGGGAGCGICAGGGVNADGGTGETGLLTMPERASSSEIPRRLSVWPVWLYNATRFFS